MSDNTTTEILVTLPSEVAEHLAEVAADQGVTAGQLARRIIEDAFNGIAGPIANLEG